MGISLDRACLECGRCWEKRDCGLVVAALRTERLEDDRPTGVRDVVLDDDRDDRLLWLFEVGCEPLEGNDIVAEITFVRRVCISVFPKSDLFHSTTSSYQCLASCISL